MDQGFVNAIAGLAKPTFMEVNGVQFSDKPMHRVVDDPRPEALEVRTLTAISDFLHGAPDTLTVGQLVLHIEGPGTVSVLGPVEGQTKKRTVHMRAKISGDPFAFGHWMDTEILIIELQAKFVDAGDRARIMQIIGLVRDEKVSTHADDGITQTVSTRKTVSGALVENSPVPNPVTLAPYRTFLEVEQPESAFVFRMRGGGDGKAPQCAIFEADGGNWKLDAVLSIKKWLKDNCPGMAVIG